MYGGSIELTVGICNLTDVGFFSIPSHVGMGCAIIQG